MNFPNEDDTGFPGMTMRDRAPREVTLWAIEYARLHNAYELAYQEYLIELVQAEPYAPIHVRAASNVKAVPDSGFNVSYDGGKHTGLAKRILYAVASPVLPFLLLARHGRAQLAKKREFGRFLLLAPLTLLLLAAWSLGEAAAYLGADR